MKTTILGVGLVALQAVASAGAAAQAIEVTVPGTSDPWLAGMPDGSTASYGDVAPNESPVEVGIALVPGTPLVFSATGTTTFAPNAQFYPPDGAPSHQSHTSGEENGISQVVPTPTCSLVGVFLDDTQPNLSPAPAGFQYPPEQFDYLSISPQLQQVFFIGDGVTGSGSVQQVIVPAEATRLFLGTMDGFGWYNNVGELRITVGPTATATTPLPRTAPELASFPNPFNPRTTLRFEVAAPSQVTLEVFDGRGRLVDTLLRGGSRQAGLHEIPYAPRRSTGVYFARLQVGELPPVVQRLVLLK